MNNRYNYIFNYIIEPFILYSKQNKNYILYEPRKPNHTECCGFGCTDCVWLSYYKEYKKYKEYKEYKEKSNN